MLGFLVFMSYGVAGPWWLWRVLKRARALTTAAVSTVPLSVLSESLLRALSASSGWGSLTLLACSPSLSSSCLLSSATLSSVASRTKHKQ